MESKENEKLSLAQKFYIVYEELGYKSNSEFAKTLGATKAAVGQWFNQNMKPGEKYIISLIKAHPNVNIYFFTRDELPVLLDSLSQNDKYMQLKRECGVKDREIVRLRNHLTSLQNTIKILKEKSH